MEWNMNGCKDHTSLQALLKRVVELVMPDLRSYYRVPRKGRIVKTYSAGNGKYVADVQPLRNDDSSDPSEPVIPEVEIPVIWAGPGRGIVCPPAVGSFCDITYYDGDPNYPRISNFRYRGNDVPAAPDGGIVIQQSDGAYIRIDPDRKMLHITDSQWSVSAAGPVSVISQDTVTITAPVVTLDGAVTSTGGVAGITTLTCNLSIAGDVDVTGNITATGEIMDGTGNSNHHSH
jgi:phage baseplate assembly protein gpV